MVQSTRAENNHYTMENCHVKNYFTLYGKRIDAYRIYKNNIIVADYIFGWKQALKTAEKYAENLFEYGYIVEILNLFTGEVVSIQEARNRANKLRARRKP